MFTPPFNHAQMTENIKAPRHRPLCREFISQRWISAHMTNNAENVFIHDVIILQCNIPFHANIHLWSLAQLIISVSIPWVASQWLIFLLIFNGCVYLFITWLRFSTPSWIIHSTSAIDAWVKLYFIYQKPSYILRSRTTYPTDKWTTLIAEIPL